MSRITLRNLRNIEAAEIALEPGLNVFCGRNAQGKTSLLEGVGLLARGRSFRTEDIRQVIQRGAASMHASGLALDDGRHPLQLEIEVDHDRCRLRVDGRDVGVARYQGELDVVVYATERLRIVRGGMRERRAFLDRGGAALWPQYRRLHRDYERTLAQRNASLQAGGRGLEAWSERLVETGAQLRWRRGRYVERLQAALAPQPAPAGERYAVELAPQPLGDVATERAELERQLGACRREERRAQRTLAGPHRDHVRLLLDGEDAASTASAGQARSLLLALTLASLEVARQERGSRGLALLDDLDSELDEERASGVCRRLAGCGQALVTTANERWAGAVAPPGGLFKVDAGQVTRSGVS